MLNAETRNDMKNKQKTYSSLSLGTSNTSAHTVRARGTTRAGRVIALPLYIPNV